MQAKWKCGLLLLLCAGAASAQVYRWKDAQGVTHFSDKPPASSVPVAKIDSRAGPSSAPDLPFVLARAVKTNPVTLYTTAQCAPCDQARAMLQTRGIPYAEKTVSNANDHLALRQAGGASQLPLLLIGPGKFIGYEQTTWDAALTAANYPLQAMLPPDYRQSPPGPAALASDAGTAVVDANDAKLPQLPAPKAAPDFQF